MKKRILTVALVVALLATCFAGTYAYLTDEHAQKNTFTAGKVGIALDEAKVDGNGRTSADQDYKLFPGTVVTKDPTITVDSDSENAWVAAKVTVSAQEVGEKDLHELIGVTGYDNIDIHALVSGGLVVTGAEQVIGWNDLPMVYKTDDCVIYQAADKANNTWTLYIFMNAQKQAKDKIVLFDTLTVPTKWDNAEMAVINTLEINVQAYAVQAEGFNDCFTAMTTAFATAFPLAPANP